MLEKASNARNSGRPKAGPIVCAGYGAAPEPDHLKDVTSLVYITLVVLYRPEPVGLVGVYPAGLSRFARSQPAMSAAAAYVD